MSIFNNINLYLLITSCCMIIFLLFYIMYIKNTNAELTLRINQQNATISVLTSERDSLVSAIEQQNEFVNKLKLDTEYYQSQIEQINAEIEQENSHDMQLETINGGENISEKEAIEWLKSKRFSLSF